jgi:alkaline phosphatase D
MKFYIPFLFSISLVVKQFVADPWNYRIAFGSCNDNADDDRIWSAISSKSPDLWIWLGDIVYMDSKKVKNTQDGNDSDVIKNMHQTWQKLYENEEYNKFVQTLPNNSKSILATWDGKK